MNMLAKLALGASPILFMAPHVSAEMPDLPTADVNYTIHSANRDAASGVLSTDGGSLVDLFFEDDGSGRQKWKFVALSENETSGTYQIIQNRTNNFLSTDGGSLVDLYHQDDNSGRQQWILQPFSNGTFTIRPSVGTNYLSTDGGEIVDLHYTDDNSGRQRWKLEPEMVTILSMELLDENRNETARPDIIVPTELLENESNVMQQQERSWSQSVSETSTFNEEHGFSVTIGVSTEVAIPGGIASATSKYEASTSHNWSSGGSNSRDTTVSATQHINVPGCSTMEAFFTIKSAEVSMPYRATGETASGEIITSTGTWEGVQVISATVSWGSVSPIPGCS